MIDQFVEVLKKKLYEAAEQYQQDILNGRCSSFDEYKYNSGVLRGLLGAVDIAYDLANLVEDEDD